MLRTTSIAAAFLLLAAPAHSRPAPAPKAPVLALYDGAKAGKGSWPTLASAGLWARPLDGDDGLDGRVEAERAWITASTEIRLDAERRAQVARDACLTEGKRRPAACRAIRPKADLPEEPEAHRAEDGIASGLARGLVRHRAALAMPDGWAEQVRLMQEEPSIDRRLEMAASWVNARLSYYRRTEDPQGRGGDASFFEWSRGVERSLADGYGDCRDWALVQYALALDGGVPADRMAIAAVLMASAPQGREITEEERRKDIVHVVVVARGDSGTLVLSQSRNGRPIRPASASPLADKGILQIAGPGGTLSFEPHSPAAMALR